MPARTDRIDLNGKRIATLYLYEHVLVKAMAMVMAIGVRIYIYIYILSAETEGLQWLQLVPRIFRMTITTIDQPVTPVTL